MGLIGKILLLEIIEDQRILIGCKVLVLVLVQLGWLTQSSGPALEGRVLGMGQEVFEIAMDSGCCV